MKKLNLILHWDNLYVEGFALCLFLIGLFHPSIFLLLLIYTYWQKRNIRFQFLIILILIVFLRFYIHKERLIPDVIQGQAKIVDRNVYTYHDVLTLKIDGNNFHMSIGHDTYQLGDLIFVDADVKSYKGKTIPYGFDQKRYYQSQHIDGYLDVHHHHFVRSTFSIFEYREQLNQYIENYQSSAYIKAFVLGERSFSSEQNMAFRDLGILYLFTVSGLHIYTLMLCIRKIFFYLSLSEKNQTIGMVFVYCIFLYLNAFSMSVVRIFLVFILHGLVKLYKLHLTKLDQLHLVFFLMLVGNIEWIYNLGFLITFLILNYLFLMSHLYQHLGGYLKRLMMSSIVMAVILPFQLRVSILMILLLPVLIYILSGPLFIAALCVLFIPESDLFYTEMIRYFEMFVSIIQDKQVTYMLPALSFYLVMIYYALLTYAFQAQHIMVFIKRSILIILVLGFGFYDVLLLDTTTLYMVDVGQGDSILIESPTCTLLIDSYQNVLPLLNNLGITHLDYMMLTHSDQDHIKEAQSIDKQIKINRIVTNPYDIYPVFINQTVAAHSGDYIVCGDLPIQFLGPIRDYGSPNNNSLVFQIKIKHKMILFTGDIEYQAEQDLIDKYGISLKSDIIKIAHHGSKTSSSLDFMRKVDPEIALISLSSTNTHGFPSPEVISRLMMRHVAIYRTDQMGTITYRSDKKKEKWIFHLPF